MLDVVCIPYARCNSDVAEQHSMTFIQSSVDAEILPYLRQVFLKFGRKCIGYSTVR